jgi:cytochrome c oxidase subunit 3
MEIPYTVAARPDTGLANPKLGIWLFLASEVMLFGGLFSCYIFQRIGAEPGYWPQGLLNVPIGFANTLILIASSVTVILAWASVKMRKFNQYMVYMALTIACGAIFLFVKLTFEWPPKFSHFGAILKKEAREKYDEKFLANKHFAEEIEAGHRIPRIALSGHLLLPHEYENDPEKSHLHGRKLIETVVHDPSVREYKILLDFENAKAKEAPAHATFLPKGMPGEKREEELEKEGKSHHEMEEILKAENLLAVVDKKDVQWASSFEPKHNNYFATYFMITGLHGAHVLGGVIVFVYFFFTGRALYRRNPEQLANRVEVSGLFWHFEDLIWIFVFPLFYLL